MSEDTLAGAGRTYPRHGGEVGIVSSFVNVGAMLWGPGLLGDIENPETRQVAIALLAGGVSGLVTMGYRWVHVSGIEKAFTDRIVNAIRGGAAAILLSLVMSTVLTACALGRGDIKPKAMTTVGGQTVVACEVSGTWFVFGKSSICRTMDGGEMSQGAVGIFTSTIETAGRIVAGLFGGIGAGLSGMGAAVPAVQVAPHAHEPAQPDVGYVSPTSGASSGVTLPDGTVYNP